MGARARKQQLKMAPQIGMAQKRLNWGHREVEGKT